MTPAKADPAAKRHRVALIPQRAPDCGILRGDLSSGNNMVRPSFHVGLARGLSDIPKPLNLPQTPSWQLNVKGAPGGDALRWLIATRLAASRI